MNNKVYRGYPDGKVTVNLPSGQVKDLDHVKLHSPTGFAWGYQGDGPADLALSILCDVLGECPTPEEAYEGRFTAQPHYQDFKCEFVGKWDMERGFETDAKLVLDWLRKRGVKTQ